MTDNIVPRSGREAGFSLIELMVTVLIVSVLVAIAIPSYFDKVLKSHRTQAKTALLDLAGREERFFNTNNTYSNTPADLGYGAGGAAFPMTVGDSYYQVDVAFTAAKVAAGVVTPATYTLTATAINNQVKDVQCATFKLDSTGQQTSSPDLTDCWK